MKRTYIDISDLSDHADKCLVAYYDGDLETWGAWNK